MNGCLELGLLLLCLTCLDVMQMGSADSPCRADSVCPIEMYHRDEVGCDSGGSTCVCQRGFILHDDVCIGERNSTLSRCFPLLKL